MALWSDSDVRAVMAAFADPLRPSKTLLARGQITADVRHHTSGHYQAIVQVRQTDGVYVTVPYLTELRKTQGLRSRTSCVTACTMLIMALLQQLPSKPVPELTYEAVRATVTSVIGPGAPVAAARQQSQTAQLPADARNKSQKRPPLPSVPHVQPDPNAKAKRPRRATEPNGGAGGSAGHLTQGPRSGGAPAPSYAGSPVPAAANAAQALLSLASVDERGYHAGGSPRATIPSRAAPKGASVDVLRAHVMRGQGGNQQQAQDDRTSDVEQVALNAARSAMNPRLGAAHDAMQDRLTTIATAASTASTGPTATATAAATTAVPSPTTAAAPVPTTEAPAPTTEATAPTTEATAPTTAATVPTTEATVPTTEATAEVLTTTAAAPNAAATAPAAAPTTTATTTAAAPASAAPATAAGTGAGATPSTAARASGSTVAPAAALVPGVATLPSSNGVIQRAAMVEAEMVVKVEAKAEVESAVTKAAQQFAGERTKAERSVLEAEESIARKEAELASLRDELAARRSKLEAITKRELTFKALHRQMSELMGSGTANAD